jgi:hypothetical protein
MKSLEAKIDKVNTEKSELNKQLTEIEALAASPEPKFR